MQILFYVKKSDQIIYKMEFPVYETWQFSEFSKLAIDDFRKQCPNISLLDKDVIMGFDNA